MEPLKSFSFGVILRNFLAGVFFLSGILIITDIPNSLKSPKDISSGLVSVAALFSLAVGTAVYAVQRTLWIPILEWMYFRNHPKPGTDDLPYCSEEGVEMMLSRWGWAADLKDSTSLGRKYSESLTSWADYIHFKFSAAFCLLIGIFFGLALEKGFVIAFGISTIALLLISGVFSDQYRHFIEDMCSLRMEKCRQNSESTDKILDSECEQASALRPAADFGTAYMDASQDRSLEVAACDQ